jgi:uncharacterized protein (TIGR02588 family)
VAASADQPTALSYAAAAVGGMVIFLLVGYLTYDATRSKAPPHLTAVVVRGDVREEGGLFYVPVVVTNEGDQAAVEVIVETVGGGGESSVQSAIDFLAGGESHRIVAVVPGPPGDAFATRVVTYQEP